MSSLKMRGQRERFLNMPRVWSGGLQLASLRDDASEAFSCPVLTGRFRILPPQKLEMFLCKGLSHPASMELFNSATDTWKQWQTSHTPVWTAASKERGRSLPTAAPEQCPHQAGGGCSPSDRADTPWSPCTRRLPAGGHWCKGKSKPGIQGTEGRASQLLLHTRVCPCSRGPIVMTGTVKTEERHVKKKNRNKNETRVKKMKAHQTTRRFDLGARPASTTASRTLGYGLRSWTVPQTRLADNLIIHGDGNSRERTAQNQFFLFCN